MPDAHFADPRLARLYDVLEGERSDLDSYVALVGELGARTVLDVGCGTGSLACLLADRGVQVVGVDPAAASLDVARAKPQARHVRWVTGDVRSLPPLQVDLATMTGNVAQVFLTDEEWAATLSAARAALRPGGYLVFETRRPERQAWRTWTRERSARRVDVPGVGVVEAWVEVTDVRGDLVSFRSSFAFHEDGALLTSRSTLRFRGREEIADSLAAAELVLEEVRDAPDRPGLEWVHLVRRPD
ncbi:bifunctional 2-polyprenyl-6-hydroxyphenol methylase/3-demethylubiquinol 3-O-methyltransferase UbiG [Geodermatophilus sp. DSM 44513]|uniref:class I SAM-dependent methyltransferase n=1 Tax=Geodermatophilus sp. DSM 44513 TaxID=1528104 RepID=UPI0012742CA9|nr:class I SAM-dependent methyltransferase [Geodermatophilus sp. DSM 44513]WNV75635.1 class I SAM-dependent methyltransferase [Geodermatophilus sp. DSM 44513]